MECPVPSEKIWISMRHHFIKPIRYFRPLTETWLNSEGNNISLAEILNTLKDFKVIQVPRENAKGGGVALFLRKAFTTTRNSGSNFTSFEHLDVSISHGKFKCVWS